MDKNNSTLLKKLSELFPEIEIIENKTLNKEYLKMNDTKWIKDGYFIILATFLGAWIIYNSDFRFFSNVYLVLMGVALLAIFIKKECKILEFKIIDSFYRLKDKVD